MAQVKLIPGINALSGTIGDITFRTINGKTFMHRRPVPSLPKNASRAQKAAFKRRVMVSDCVILVQSQMDDFLTAMKLRETIRKRLLKLYDKHHKTIKTPTKLKRTIMTEYYQSFGRTSPRQSREYIETLSNHSRHDSNPIDLC